MTSGVTKQGEFLNLRIRLFLNCIHIHRAFFSREKYHDGFLHRTVHTKQRHTRGPLMLMAGANGDTCALFNAVHHTLRCFITTICI